LKQAVKKIIKIILKISIKLLLKIFKLKIITVNHKRIGHFCLDLDALIKEKILKKSNERYLLIKEKNSANTAMYDYFSKYTIIIDNPILKKIVKLLILKLDIHLNVSKKYSENHKESLMMYKIFSKWNKRKPLFNIKKRDLEKSLYFLKQRKISTNRFLVCFHCRTSIFSGGDSKDFGQTFRNFDAKVFEKAIKLVIKKGGIAIRMGDPDRIKLKIKSKYYFDYANYKFKKDYLDIFFCSQAKLFVGNTSGLSGLSYIFGKPIAACNMIPVTSTLVFSKQDTGIPMLIKYKNKKINFRKIFQSPLRNAQEDKIYMANKDFEIIPNSQNEVCDLVLEKLNEINSTFKMSSKDKILQKRFKKFFQNGDSRFHSKSKIGVLFLRKYQHLL